MHTQQSPADQLPTEHLARAVGVIALAAVAVIHVLDLPSTLTATPLIGYGYFILIIAALACAAMLMVVPQQLVWVLADLIAVGAIFAYVFSRTTGLPTDHLDVGNWNCALGIAAVSTETLIMLLAVWRMQPRRLLLGVGGGSRASVTPKVMAPMDPTG